ncbi:hypothetical protein HG535_0B04860 [Zygotorulaspora mrakii]|uniref:Carboxymuconolactone decarboxylase-like domain-containing protein n=1 Tax=Zygotorulaspora mrakii TaxID=42260 RepID=A0A7H9AZ72_ZYGMR|nr:uncharacterized protein HG535_0B04860 [Zygotorulaspora mrakii]QLG71444.1 hypothetical protein HG535_0B04860 [Zygotorulaspora mrakii]
MNQLLNAQRLVQVSQFHPKLQNIWYLVAAVTFSVCNQPQEIPKIYHYVMLLNNNNSDHHDPSTLANRTIETLQNDRMNLRKVIDEKFPQPTQLQRQLTEKFREALLKTGPLAGLPKAINVLSNLRDVTPTALLPSSQEIDPFKAERGEGPLYSDSVMEIHAADSNKSKERDLKGIEHWNHLYTKVSKRIVNNINSACPDLWYYIMEHVYGPLLSCDDILSKQETSFIVIASLVPQDVNPQLRGHLKGALNIGCDPNTIEAVRALAVLISQWCGVSWKGEIVKL